MAASGGVAHEMIDETAGGAVSPGPARSAVRPIWALSGLSTTTITSRLVFFGLVLMFGVVSATCVVIASRWIDRPFAGFLMNERMVTGNVGRYDWTGTQVGLKYPDKIVAANGQPIATMKDSRRDHPGDASGRPDHVLGRAGSAGRGHHGQHDALHLGGSRDDLRHHVSLRASLPVTRCRRLPPEARCARELGLPGHGSLSRPVLDDGVRHSVHARRVHPALPLRPHAAPGRARSPEPALPAAIETARPASLSPYRAVPRLGGSDPSHADALPALRVHGPVPDRLCLPDRGRDEHGGIQPHHVHENGLGPRPAASQGRPVRRGARISPPGPRATISLCSRGSRSSSTSWPSRSRSSPPRSRTPSGGTTCSTSTCTSSAQWGTA